MWCAAIWLGADLRGTARAVERRGEDRQLLVALEQTLHGA
jgi:hypothetical protein